MSKLQNALIGGVRTVLGHLPAAWLPGASPDQLADKRVTLGTQQSRIDGPEKVRGTARFAADLASPEIEAALQDQFHLRLS